MNFINHPAFKFAAASTILAALAHIWARHIEVNRFVVRNFELPILPAGSAEIKILHLSDAHLLPQQQLKRKFLRQLADLEPDLVVNTGDNVANSAAISAIAEDLGPLLKLPGVLALGSNDRFAASKRNIARYLLKDPRPKNLAKSKSKSEKLPLAELVSKLTAGGWVNISNARTSFHLKGLTLEFVGVDDAHHHFDSFPKAQDSSPTLKIGVTHAPYLRVLDQFIADGAQLLLAGHTHGGQLCLPYLGALVTNCDLPRQKAKGISSHRSVPLHVSGGLGANPYHNMRTFNRPEVSLLTLRAKA